MKGEASLSCSHQSGKAAYPATVSYRRLVIRLIFVVGFMVAASLYARSPTDDNMTTFVAVGEKTDRRAMDVKCSMDYKEEKHLFPGILSPPPPSVLRDTS